MTEHTKAPSLEAEDLTTCPACSGEITFVFGLGGGGVDSEDGKVPGVYWVCLDCDWMGPRPEETVCFPHGLVDRKDGAA